MATFADAFTRADGAFGSNWTARAGTFAIVSNQFNINASGGTNGYTEVNSATANFIDDHEAEITVHALATADYVGPAVRITASGCYCIRADGNSLTGRRIHRIDGTTRTQIGTVNIGCSNGDTLKLRAVGTTITAYVNGVQVDSVTDATYSTGQPGVFYDRQNTGVSRGDNFSAADVTSVSLTDVDTDEIITTGQASVAYTGTGLASADAMLVKTGTKSASATSFSATNATSGTFTAPSLSAVRTGGVKFGSVTFEVKQSSTSLGTLAGTLNPESGWTVHNVSDISQAGDTGCLYYGQSPAIAVGDQILFKATTTTNAWPVTVDSQGFFTVNSGGSEAEDTFTYYVWDATDETWGTVGTVTVNQAAASFGTGTATMPARVGAMMARG